MPAIKIAPSILSADLLRLQSQIEEVEANGADMIHVDVMDGHFVPNITFGPVIVHTLKTVTRLPLDVHLMIENPDQYIEQFVDAGATFVTVHQEASVHLHRSVQLIKSLGSRAGITLNPGTEITTLETLLSEVDLVLVMTVNPGFGGQGFLEFCLPKISWLAEKKRRHGFGFEIEVDGGINGKTVSRVVNAGAEILVAGNAIFGQPHAGEACRNLKKIAQSG